MPLLAECSPHGLQTEDFKDIKLSVTRQAARPGNTEKLRAKASMKIFPKFESKPEHTDRQNEETIEYSEITGTLINGPRLTQINLVSYAFHV